MPVSDLPPPHDVMTADDESSAVMIHAERFLIFIMIPLINIGVYFISFPPTFSSGLTYPVPYLGYTVGAAQKMAFSMTLSTFSL